MKKIILIVDDDLDDRELFSDALNEMSSAFELVQTSNAMEALDYLERCEINVLPAVILIDYRMPGLSGQEFLQKVAMLHRLDTIPKIVWSSSANVDDCLRFGACNCFAKPDSVANLQAIVRVVIEYANRLPNTKHLYRDGRRGNNKI